MGRAFQFGLVIAAAALFASAAHAQAPAPADTAKPAPAPQKKDPPPPPIVFFIAKGEAHACGPGCAEWIAADGTFDGGAPARLRALLAKTAKRKLPIYFHSPGGSVVAAMEIGRMMRVQKIKPASAAPSRRAATPSSGARGRATRSSGPAASSPRTCARARPVFRLASTP